MSLVSHFPLTDDCLDSVYSDGGEETGNPFDYFYQYDPSPMTPGKTGATAFFAKNAQIDSSSILISSLIGKKSFGISAWVYVVDGSYIRVTLGLVYGESAKNIVAS